MSGGFGKATFPPKITNGKRVSVGHDVAAYLQCPAVLSHKQDAVTVLSC